MQEQIALTFLLLREAWSTLNVMPAPLSPELCEARALIEQSAGALISRYPVLAGFWPLPPCTDEAHPTRH